MIEEHKDQTCLCRGCYYKTGGHNPEKNLSWVQDPLKWLCPSGTKHDRKRHQVIVASFQEKILEARWQPRKTVCGSISWTNISCISETKHYRRKETRLLLFVRRLFYKNRSLNPEKTVLVSRTDEMFSERIRKEGNVPWSCPGLKSL